MRSPEELAADISVYKIVVMPTVETFELRSIEDAKRHFETHPEAAGILEKLPVEKMRFPCEIRSGNPHPKTDNYNIFRMENHIRETWTCGEIIMFRSFTETGTFKPYEAACMKRIFDGLNNEVYIFMGAAAVLGEMNAKMCCGIFTDDGAILGLTINELRQLFNGKQTVLTRLDKLENGIQKMPTARTVAALMRGKVEFGKTLDTIEKAVTNIDHTCNGTAANVAEVLTNTPSLEMMQRLETLAHAGKKPETAISQPTAVEIFNLLLPHKTITQQTLSNWLKRGNCPKAGLFPIAQTDLASKAAFMTWVQNYATAAGTQTVQLTKELIAKINAL